MADEDLDIPDLDSSGFEEEERSKRGRRILATLLAFVLLSGGAFGGWVYYWEFLVPKTEEEVPLVMADVPPMKVRPEEPGGMKIPNQDKLVYDASRETKPRGERLMPPPETPISLPALKAETAGAPAPASPRAGRPLPPRLGARSVASLPLLPAGGSRMTPATEAAKVPLSAPQVAAKFEPAPAPPPAPKPEAAMPAPPPAPPEAAKPKTAAMPKPPPAPVPPPAPKPGAAVAPPPPPPAAGDYRLQLASLRSDEAARREWSRLKRLHTDLLGDLDLALIRVNIPGKGVYHRVRVGPLADAEAALSLCAKLALRKVGCLVAKP